MTHVELAPSLLSADFGELARAAEICEKAGAERLHFDVMDGLFVPNITFGTQPLKALRHRSGAVFDTHLMIVQPERYIEEFAEAGADVITIQAEATTHLQRTLALIRSTGKRAGLALNPATPLSVLDYLLDDIDQLLIMTVNPGFSGQEFIPAMMRKIADARRVLDAASRPIALQVDGGVGPENAGSLVRAGATILVSGSGIFGHPDGPAAGIAAIRKDVEDSLRETRV